mmetsp:Transcript_86446/g.245104  ORF Transcript_86446/g.245104 Transcript_86446/m.245104 type:complete len:257 (-) Transcript_86446:95-865(-)
MRFPLLLRALLLQGVAPDQTLPSFQDDLSPGCLQFCFHCLCFRSGHPFLDHFWRAFDEILGFLQTKRGQPADLLHHHDFLRGLETQQLHREELLFLLLFFRLLRFRSSCVSGLLRGGCGCRRGRGCSSLRHGHAWHRHARHPSACEHAHRMRKRHARRQLLLAQVAQVGGFDQRERHYLIRKPEHLVRGFPLGRGGTLLGWVLQLGKHVKGRSLRRCTTSQDCRGAGHHSLERTKLATYPAATIAASQRRAPHRSV